MNHLVDYEAEDGLLQPIKFLVDNGFNYINLAFVVGRNPNTENEAHSEIFDLPENRRKSFILFDATSMLDSMTKDQIDETVNYAEQNGARILLSIGGATDHIDEYALENGDDYGRQAAELVKKYKLHGVDFDFEIPYRPELSNEENKQVWLNTQFARIFFKVS